MKLGIVAPIYEAWGYSTIARNLVTALLELNIDIKIFPVSYWIGKDQYDASSIKEKWSNLVVPSIEELEGRIIVNITTPDKFLHLEGHKNIGYTTTETIKVATHFALPCNSYDAVLAPTDWSIEALANSGVDKDILYKVPLGIDLTKFHPGILPLNISTHSFTFLSVFNWIWRKGWDILLEAYFREFTAKDDVTLLMLARRPNETEEKRKAILNCIYARQQQLAASAPPHVVLHSDFIIEDSMPTLYALANTFVLPSRGEGLGLPYLEAGAMRIPSIATNWSAHTEYLTNTNSYLIDVTDIAINENLVKEMPIYRDLPFAEPSVEHLRQQMRLCYEDSKMRKEKGDKILETVEKQWDIRENAKQFLSTIEDINTKVKPSTRKASVLLAVTHVFSLDDLDISIIIEDLKVRYNVTCVFVYDWDRNITNTLQRFERDDVTYIHLPTDQNKSIDATSLIDIAHEIKDLKCIVSCARIGMFAYEAARMSHIPHIYIASNYVFLFDAKKLTNYSSIQNEKFESLVSEEYRNLLENSKIVVTSQYMKRFVREVYQCNSILWIPTVQLAKHEDDCIGIVSSPYENITNYIESLYPDERFIYSGTSDDQPYAGGAPEFCSKVKRILCVTQIPLSYSSILRCAAASCIPTETLNYTGYIPEVLWKGTHIGEDNIDLNREVSQADIALSRKQASALRQQETPFHIIVNTLLSSGIPSSIREDTSEKQNNIEEEPKSQSIEQPSNVEEIIEEQEPQPIEQPTKRESSKTLIKLYNLYDATLNWVDIIPHLSSLADIEVLDSPSTDDSTVINCRDTVASSAIDLQCTHIQLGIENRDEHVLIGVPVGREAQTQQIVDIAKLCTSKYQNVMLVGLGYGNDLGIFDHYIKLNSAQELNSAISQMDIVLDTSINLNGIQRRCRRFKVLCIATGNGESLAECIYVRQNQLATELENILINGYDNNFSEFSTNENLEDAANNVLRLVRRIKISSVAANISSSKKSIALFKIDGVGGTITLSDHAEKIKLALGDEYSIVPIIRSGKELFDGNPYIDSVVELGHVKWGQSCNELVQDAAKEFDLVADIKMCTAKWKGEHPFTQYSDDYIKQAYENFPFSMNGLGRYKLHKVQLVNKCLGLSYKTINTRVYLTDEDYEIADQYTDPYIIIAPGTDPIHSKQTKSWPWSYWEQLVKDVDQLVLQVGLTNDQLIKGVIDLRGKTDLRQLCAILQKANKIVTLENGIMHLAYAVGHTDTTVLRGPTEKYLFAYPGQKEVTSSVCDPCWWTSPDWHSRCIQNADSACMKKITPSQVHSTVFISANDSKYTNIVVDLASGNSNRGIGDTILTTVGLRALKKKYDLPLTCIVRDTAKAVLENNPHIDKIVNNTDGIDIYGDNCLYLPLYTRLESYRIERNRQNRIDSILQLFGVDTDNKVPDLYLTNKEEEDGRRRMKDGINIGVSLESAAASRTWPVEYFLQLVDMLGDGYHFHIFGTHTDVPNHDRVTTYRTTLRELFGIVNSVDMVLTTDSLLSHVSGALRKPMVVLYTTIPAEWRCSYYEKCISIQAPIVCSPCYDFQKSITNECRSSEVKPCIRSIAAELVYNKIVECINKFVSTEV